MTEPTLPGILPPVRDELDRRYTPQSLADAIVDRLHITPKRVLEPSVGGGAFARAARRRWPACKVFGVDVDPASPGANKCNAWLCGDFLSFKPSMLEHVDLILGNPPFGQALDHVRHALTFECPVVFVLPLAYLGVQSWAPFLTGLQRPVFVWPIVGRPWNVLREAAVYGWDPRRSPGDETTLALLTDWGRVRELPTGTSA